MKLVFPAFCLLLLIIAGCSKDARRNAPLLGRWVDVQHRQDTLEVYISGGKTIMFDNSAVNRQSMATRPGEFYFRSQVLLKNDEIGFKTINAPRSEPYNFYPFHWVTYNTSFTMPYNGLRPYVSSMGTITYEKVK